MRTIGIATEMETRNSVGSAGSCEDQSRDSRRTHRRSALTWDSKMLDLSHFATVGLILNSF